DADESRLRTEPFEQLSRQHLATEEQRRILDVEDAEAPVRGTTISRCRSRRSRFEAPDPAYQPMDRVRFVELHPHTIRQEARELAQPFGPRAWQEHGDDWIRAISNRPIQRRSNLLVMPRPSSARPEEHDAPAALLQCLAHRVNKWLPGDEV